MSGFVARACFVALLVSGETLAAEESHPPVPKLPEIHAAKWASFGEANRARWGATCWFCNMNMNSDGSETNKDDTDSSGDGPVNTNDTGGGVHAPHQRH